MEVDSTWSGQGGVEELRRCRVSGRVGAVGIFGWLMVLGWVLGFGTANAGNLFFQEAIVDPGGSDPWSLRVTGEVASLSGCGVVVHDAAGEVVLVTRIPHGNHGSGMPVVIPIEAAGDRGPFRVVLVGQQEDVRGLQLPLSDAVGEVYTGEIFAMRDTRPLLLRVVEEQEVELKANSGTVRLIDEETAVFESKPGQKGDAVPVTLEPEKFYRVDLDRAFYFQIKPGALLVFDPDRWFAPGPSVADAPWWRTLDVTAMDDLVDYTPFEVEGTR